MEVRVGAGAYVCGEETSLLESLEGKRGEVRAKPPLPALVGLFGQPTIINNVLTLAAVPLHPRRGRRRPMRITAWAARAARCRSSSPAISGMAACSRPRSGSRSASWSTTSAAARCPAGRSARCRSAGRSAPISRRRMFHLPFDYEAFAAADGLIGHAGIVVFDDSVDMAQMARFAMEFCAAESCGKCTPCRIGSIRGMEVIDRVHRRRGRRRQSRAGRGTVRDDEVRIALRAGRFYPLSGDVGAEAFPGGLRPRARSGDHVMTLIREADHGTPASPRAETGDADDRRRERHRPRRHLDHARRQPRREPDPEALRDRQHEGVRLVPDLPGRDRGPRRHARLLHDAGRRGHGRASRRASACSGCARA